MSDVDLLRRAAALMRERAEAATPGPWFANPGGYVELNPFGEGEHFNGVADTWNALDGKNAEHVAAWHPAVALAVADWLDGVAQGLARKQLKHVNRAVNVARAYLGEQP